MSIKQSFGVALKQARLAKKLTQEDFGVVSSRTYVSTIERGMKSVTIEKLEEFSHVLNIHPLTLLSLAYLQGDTFKTEELLTLIRSELVSVSITTLNDI